jgi:hypothetical protein
MFKQCHNSGKVRENLAYVLEWGAKLGREAASRPGCQKRLAQGQWWGFCGESDMGQTMPALCVNCGGEYTLATVQNGSPVNAGMRLSAGEDGSVLDSEIHQEPAP